jgi:hypothetical protein
MVNDLLLRVRLVFRFFVALVYVDVYRQCRKGETQKMGSGLPFYPSPLRLYVLPLLLTIIHG